MVFGIKGGQKERETGRERNRFRESDGGWDWKKEIYFERVREGERYI